MRPDSGSDDRNWYVFFGPYWCNICWDESLPFQGLLLFYCYAMVRGIHPLNWHAHGPRGISRHIHPFLMVVLRSTSEALYCPSDVTSLTGISHNLIRDVGTVNKARTLKRRSQKLVTAVQVCWILILSEISGTESSPFKGDACFTHEYSHHLPRLIQVSQFPLSPISCTHVGESCWGVTKLLLLIFLVEMCIKVYVDL